MPKIELDKYPKLLNEYQHIYRKSLLIKKIEQILDEKLKDFLKKHEFDHIKSLFPDLVTNDDLNYLKKFIDSDLLKDAKEVLKKLFAFDDENTSYYKSLKKILLTPEDKRTLENTKWDSMGTAISLIPDSHSCKINEADKHRLKDFKSSRLISKATRIVRDKIPNNVEPSELTDEDKKNL